MLSFIRSGHKVEENRIGLVLLLLREGSIWDAAKFYQEEVGVSLAEAKQRVRMLARAHGIRCHSNGIVPLAILAMATLLGVLCSF